MPENRTVSNSPKIRLAVAILKAKSRHPRPDPIVFLDGGPGLSGLGRASQITGWNRDREVILLGQRGSLKSKPFLACPEIDRARVRAGQLITGSPRARATSLAGVGRAGVD